jgi:hypothetical protein
VKYPLGTLTKCVIENNFTESTASLTSNSLRVQIFFIATNYISSAQMCTSFYFTLNFKVFESAWHFFNLCLQNWLANSFGSLLFRRFSHPKLIFGWKHSIWQLPFFSQGQNNIENFFRKWVERQRFQRQVKLQSG